MTMYQLACFTGRQSGHIEYRDCQIVAVVAPKLTAPADMDIFAVCTDADGHKVIAITCIVEGDTKEKFRMRLLSHGLTVVKAYRWNDNLDPNADNPFADPFDEPGAAIVRKGIGGPAKAAGTKTEKADKRPKAKPKKKR